MSMTMTAKQCGRPSILLKMNGELVIMVDGRLSFDALQRRLVTSPAKARQMVEKIPASYVAFDLLAYGGVDLRTQRWTIRRARLEQLAEQWQLPLQVAPVTADIEEAREWFDVLPEAMGIEGLVVKGGLWCSQLAPCLFTCVCGSSSPET
jgi:ATP-dependent DNA ligase